MEKWIHRERCTVLVWSSITRRWLLVPLDTVRGSLLHPQEVDTLVRPTIAEARLQKRIGYP